jgi:hypothetical protein
METRRHDRQMRVPAVGEDGQRRIEASSMQVRLDGLAGVVAARYLAGAGVGSLRLANDEQVQHALAVDPAVKASVDASIDAEAVDASDGAGLRDPSARSLLRGARAALRALRSALEATA